MEQKQLALIKGGPPRYLVTASIALLGAQASHINGLFKHPGIFSMLPESAFVPLAR
jgi:hypothetical protein